MDKFEKMYHWRKNRYEFKLDYEGDVMKKKVMMIDPPSGWKYGFPKVLPEEAKGHNLEWLVENGYPQSEIDSLGKYFYCRCWEQEIEDEHAD